MTLTVRSSTTFYGQVPSGAYQIRARDLRSVEFAPLGALVAAVAAASRPALASRSAPARRSTSSSGRSSATRATTPAASCAGARSARSSSTRARPSCATSASGRSSGSPVGAAPTPDDRTEVLFPLALAAPPGRTTAACASCSSRRSWTGAATTAGDAGRRVPFTLFPFVFWRHDAEHGTQGGVLPFYLDLTDVLGYERVAYGALPRLPRARRAAGRAALLRLPVRVDRRRRRTAAAVRVWPFYGTQEIAGRERDALRPVAVLRRERAARPRVRLGAAPARPARSYAALDGDVGAPAAAGASSPTPTPSTSAPAPRPSARPGRSSSASARLGEEDWRVWRLAPFYGRSDRDGIRSRF